MNWQKFLITFVVVFVVFNILSFLVHVLWLSSDYQQLASVWRIDMDKYMWVSFVTAVFYCFFFVFIFARGQENKGIMEGIRYGLIIWAFYSIPVLYNQFMAYPISYSLVLKWLFGELVTVIILGVITALVYKPKEAK